MAKNSEKGKEGFQPIYTPQEIERICNLYQEYIINNDMPIVKEFSLNAKIPYATLYEIPEFRELTRQCTQKKEVFLEKTGMKDKDHATFIIFSLKQLGWKDKQEVELTEKRPIVADNELLD